MAAQWLELVSAGVLPLLLAAALAAGGADGRARARLAVRVRATRRR